MTNNQAEYTAFVRALERAAMLGLEGPVLLKSDSELIVKQMRANIESKTRS
jgi:ribonuclease HI